VIKRRHKRERFSEAALTRKMLDIAHDYLELQRLRSEVEKLEKRRKANRRGKGRIPLEAK